MGKEFYQEQTEGNGEGQGVTAKNAKQAKKEKSGSMNRDFNRRWEEIDADFTGTKGSG